MGIPTVRIHARTREGGSFISAARAWLFGISKNEVHFEQRRFPTDQPLVRERLERAGGAFVDGYNAGLRERGDLRHLAKQLDEEDADLHGFAREGAAMGLALVDLVAPWGASRWRAFLHDQPHHSYLILVGAGWAFARMRRRTLPAFARDADALLWPLMWDGYGFHQGFFRRSSPMLSGYASRAFDQGLGRSLWFVDAAAPLRIRASIDAFPPERRGDLWSGVGLACCYAGGVADETIITFVNVADRHRDHFAQGVVFAAKARQRAGNPTEGAERACRIVCGVDLREAAAIADHELELTPHGAADEPRYEKWRQRIRSRF